MPRITRRIWASSFTVILARFLEPFLDVPLPPGTVPFQQVFPSLFVCDFGVREAERVLAPRLLSSLRNLQASPFVHFSFCLLLMAISLLPFDASLTSFCFCLSPVFLSRFFRFWPRYCESSSMIHQKFLHHGCQSLVARWHILLLDVLIVSCQHGLDLFRLTFRHFVRASQNVVRRNVFGRQQNFVPSRVEALQVVST